MTDPCARVQLQEPLMTIESREHYAARTGQDPDGEIWIRADGFPTGRFAAEGDKLLVPPESD